MYYLQNIRSKPLLFIKEHPKIDYKENYYKAPALIIP